MAGCKQEQIGLNNVTKIRYYLFVKECQHLYFAPIGSTLNHFNGRDRKLTLNRIIKGESVKDAFMVNHESKLIGSGKCTCIQHDTFVEECRCIWFASGDLDPRFGMDKKLTIHSIVISHCEVVQTKLHLEGCIKILTTIKDVCMPLVGQTNTILVQLFLLEPRWYGASFGFE
jgi:hypothetical protein